MKIWKKFGKKKVWDTHHLAYLKGSPGKHWMHWGASEQTAANLHFKYLLRNRDAE